MSGAGIRYNTSDTGLKSRPGTDLRIWLSFDLHSTLVQESERRDLSEQIVNALGAVGLRLETSNQPVTLNPVERLVRGEALSVEANNAT